MATKKPSKFKATGYWTAARPKAAPPPPVPNINITMAANPTYTTNDPMDDADLDTPYDVQEYFAEKHSQSQLCVDPAYTPKSPEWRENFGVTIGTRVWPVALNAEKIPTLLYGRKTETEWKVYGYQLFLCPPERDGYDKSEYYFVQFKEPVDEVYIGFVVHVDKLYFIHAKTEVRGRPEGVERTVSVQGSKGKVWEVLVYKNGDMSCNCPSWIYKNGRANGCKHTKKVTDENL